MLLRSLSVYVIIGLGVGLTVSISIFVGRLFPTLEAYAILDICSHQHFSPTVNINGDMSLTDSASTPDHVVRGWLFH
jgi:hypothetical protein